MTNQNKGVTTNPQQQEKCCKNDCLFKTNVQFLNHHQVSEQRLKRDLNARLAEFRIEEHHEERVGTNIL